MKLGQSLQNYFLTPDLQNIINASPKQIGSLEYDQWGFNTSVSHTTLGVVKKIYDLYYRTEAYGLENIPGSGRALIIANHSGFLPMDGVLIGVAMAFNPHGARIPRAMIERFFPTVPWLGNMLNSVGGVVGDAQNCIDMLNREEAVLVFPEGARGTGKGWRNRYQLQRFGTGFMHLAIETNTPIIPVGVAGCEESFPMIGNLSSLADALHVPYIPIGLPFPLPSKVVISFGKPMRFDLPAQNEHDIRQRVSEVKNAISALIETSRQIREKHAQ